MTDKPNGKRWGWIVVLVLVLVIYPLSAMPVSLGVMKLEECGLFKEDSLADTTINAVVDSFYAPLSWIEGRLAP